MRRLTSECHECGVLHDSEAGWGDFCLGIYYLFVIFGMCIHVCFRLNFGFSNHELEDQCMYRVLWYCRWAHKLFTRCYSLWETSTHEYTCIIGIIFCICLECSLFVLEVILLPSVKLKIIHAHKTHTYCTYVLNINLYIQLDSWPILHTLLYLYVCNYCTIIVRVYGLCVIYCVQYNNNVWCTLSPLSWCSF